MYLIDLLIYKIFVDIHIGFKQDSMTVVGMLNEYINLEIKHFSGTLQSGLIISLILQLKGPEGIVYLSINFMSIIFKTGISFNSSILKFGQNISSHTVNFNVSQLIIAFNVTSETFNFTGRLISQQASFIHITLNPVEVNVHYIPNIVSQPTMSMQTFSAAKVSPFTTTMNSQPFSAAMTSSVTLAMSMQTFSAVTETSATTTLSTSNFSLLPVIVGVGGAILIIAIIIIVIGFIGVYFYGIHKGKQMSINSNCQEMTTLPNQPSILTEYEYLPVIASSSTEQRDENEYQKISEIPLTMAEFSKNRLENHRCCDNVIHSSHQRSSHTFIPSSTSAEYTTLCTSTLEKRGDYAKVLHVFPNS